MSIQSPSLRMKYSFRRTVGNVFFLLLVLLHSAYPITEVKNNILLSTNRKRGVNTKAIRTVMNSSSKKKNHQLRGGESTGPAKQNEVVSKWTTVRQAIFPIYGNHEVTKFLLIGSIKFFIILALTLTRDTKDTLVVTQCGAEAIAFLKVCKVVSLFELVLKEICRLFLIDFYLLDLWSFTCSYRFYSSIFKNVQCSREKSSFLHNMYSFLHLLCIV